MKHITPIFLGCSIFLLGTMFTQCKKDKGSSVTTHPTTGNIDTINIDTSNNVVAITNIDSTTFALPTAFTPNGDGKNDVYRAVASNPSVITSYALSVYQSNGILVFHTTSIDSSWDGRVNNVEDTAYRYEVHVNLTTASGATLNTDSYLFLLTSNDTTGCANDHPADESKYIFGDQIDVANATHPYPTSETFCY
ncbi:MAG TPA: gliding motility-associated C-terminal domain-containing protein [Candidatus Babeliaceae bacterium]|nr:gliding motility-associated C-terminal domain-containing protein [Candidatus Babeliaceae bacterium]